MLLINSCVIEVNGPMNQFTKKVFGFSLMAVCILFLTSFGSVVLPENFVKLLSRANLNFACPDSLLSTPVLSTYGITYEYAIKYPHKNFEVRYAIRPCDNLWKQYELNKKNIKKGDIETNPDSVYMSAFETFILNVSGQLPKITEFDKASVKNEFNAAWGGTVAVIPRKEFAQNYKYCMIVALHKSHQGDAYIFYLADSTDGFDRLLAPAFHALKFK